MFSMGVTPPSGSFAKLDARVLGADEDDVLLGQELPEHGDDADLERLGLRAAKDGQRLARHAGAHVGELEDRRRRPARDDGARGARRQLEGRRCGVQRARRDGRQQEPSGDTNEGSHRSVTHGQKSLGATSDGVNRRTRP
jgi:hypothetical protein